MATPRVVGRLRFHRLRPALPSCTSSCSALPTSPTVALQSASTSRISPDGRRSVAKRPSLATSWTLVPAERAIFAPDPGRSSTAWITVPTGMFRRGSALPGRLPTWDKPQSACLSSRIPFGVRITVEELSRVGRAERALKDMGFRQVRVRVHGDVARVEVEECDIARLVERREEVTAALTALGYRFVAVDLRGVRSG